MGAAPGTHRRWLAEVEHVGAGFQLVHRRVYEVLQRRHPGPLPWYAEEVYLGAPVRKDWTFCRRARAAGFPVKVHTGVVVGHYKLLPVHPGSDALGRSRRPPQS